VKDTRRLLFLTFIVSW